MTDRPDLPGLEEVDASPWGITYRSAVRIEAFFTFVKLAFIVYFFTDAWQTYNDKAAATGSWIAVIPALFGIAFLAWLVNGLMALCYWKSTPSGLLVRGFLRSRFVKWTSIQSVSKTKSHFEYVFRITADGGVKIDVPLELWPYDLLTLSIYQHLRRVGKDYEVLISPHLHTLWEEIPDSIPSSIEWHDPVPVPWKASFDWMIFLISLVTLLLP